MPDVVGTVPVRDDSANAVGMVEVDRSSAFSVIGLYALCTYLISGYATDLSFRFLGTKPYVSMISGIVVFVCFLFSGRALAALQSTVGKLWVLLAVWMSMATLFSQWRGGSIEVLQVYIPKHHMVLFYMTAFALTIRDCRALLRACAIGGFVLILTCFFFGAPDDMGRFDIPSNVYLSNPNELAMELVLCFGFFLFLIRQPGLIGRIAGVLGMLGASFYLLKTGSRGGLVASIVFVLLWVLFSENRIRFIVSAAPVIVILLFLMPEETLHRLTLIFVNPETQAATTVDEEKTIASQMSRTYLLKKGIEFAVNHPIFGVGPGGFAEELERAGKKSGRHEASVGPHNTYTQLAAECGFPALLIFIAAIWTTVRSSFRLYKKTVRDPSQSVTSALAFSCFLTTASFSAYLFFHHMAYSGDVAMVVAFWASTELAARNVRPQIAAAL